LRKTEGGVAEAVILLVVFGKRVLVAPRLFYSPDPRTCRARDSLASLIRTMQFVCMSIDTKGNATGT
jgi:hypothetical protein